MQFVQALRAQSAEYPLRHKRPFVTLSYAQSLDGCIYARPGESLALSGKQSLTLTHRLRATHDAILVGIGTVLSDDPRLNTRLVRGPSPAPVVVDTSLRLPLSCKLLSNSSSRPPTIISANNADEKRRTALEKAGATVLVVPREENGLVNLNIMLALLYELGHRSVMVEGGARIITSFLSERIANYLVMTIAPVLVGGLRAVSDLGQSAGNLKLNNFDHKWLGDDLILWGDLI